MLDEDVSEGKGLNGKVGLEAGHELSEDMISVLCLRFRRTSWAHVMNCSASVRTPPYLSGVSYGEDHGLALSTADSIQAWCRASVVRMDPAALVSISQIFLKEDLKGRTLYRPEC